MNNTITHDNFVRAVLSDKNIAAAYFQSYLPTALTQLLNFSTLTQLPETYVSENLYKTISDIVYACNTHNGTKQVKVILLIEHKSYPDKYASVQMGCYIFSVLRKQLINKEPLSVVIPLLLYHGKGKWPYRRLSSLFDGLDPEWKPFIPDFEYLYTDLGEVPDMRLSRLKNKFLRGFLLLLKHGVDRIWLKGNIKRLMGFADGVNQRLVRQYLIYTLDKVDITEEEMEKIANSLPESIKRHAMNVIQRYYENGKLKGRLEGKAEAALFMKRNGYPMKHITACTGFTAKEVKRMELEGVNSVIAVLFN